MFNSCSAYQISNKCNCHTCQYTDNRDWWDDINNEDYVAESNDILEDHTDELLYH